MTKRLIRRKRLKIDPERLLVAPKGDGTDVWTPAPPDHPVYALVGQISARWTWLEQVLDFCIGRLADIQDPIVACVTAQMMGHAPRCLTIKALAHWRGLAEIEDEAERLNNELYRASEKRNRAIHDRFVVQESDGRLAKNHRMSKKQLHYGIKEFDQTELNQALAQIELKINHCHQLLKMIEDQAYIDVP